MITRKVIGKRIVKVQQRMAYNSLIGKMENAVLYLLLEDGTKLIPHTNPQEDCEPSVDFVVRQKPQNREGDKPK